MRRSLAIVAQVLLVGLVAWFVWSTLSREVDELGRVDLALEFRWTWIGAAFGTVLVTYSVLIEAWRTILRGWDQTISYPRAARIWCVSNLGRYLPGKVWSLAGLAVLATREGVAAWAAGGSALVMQFIALAAGVAVVAATAPVAGVAIPVHTSLMWVAAFISVGVVAFLATRDALARVGRTVRPDLDVKPLAPAAAIRAVVAAALSWFLYGAALWMLAHGTGAATITVSAAVSAFTTSYIAGLLAVFVPGGIGVREGAMVVMLAPGIGAGPALALAIVSRILMTAAELAAAGLAVLSTRGAPLETT